MSPTTTSALALQPQCLIPSRGRGLGIAESGARLRPVPNIARAPDPEKPIPASPEYSAASLRRTPGSALAIRRGEAPDALASQPPGDRLPKRTWMSSFFSQDDKHRDIHPRHDEARAKPAIPCTPAKNEFPQWDITSWR